MNGYQLMTLVKFTGFHCSTTDKRKLRVISTNNNLELEMTQSSPIAMHLMNLTKNMNFTLKCSERMAYKLILMQ